MILGCKCMKGIMFVEVLLLKLKMIKEVFMYEIESGAETFIPKDLSQDILPMSYKFYDPIIAIVQENVSNTKREILALK
jgi:hypothetical protein